MRSLLFLLLTAPGTLFAVDITDDFETGLGAWTVDQGGTWSTFSGELLWQRTAPNYSNNRLRHNTSIGNNSHYVKSKIDGKGDTDVFSIHGTGFIFRGNGAGGPAYQMKLATAGTTIERYVGGSYQEAMTAEDNGVTASSGAAWYGMTVEGSGPATEVRVWRWASDPDSGAPVDVDLNWGAPNITFTLSGSDYVDTGSDVGYRTYSLNINAGNWYADDFAAGDYAPAAPAFDVILRRRGR